MYRLFRSHTRHFCWIRKNLTKGFEVGWKNEVVLSFWFVSHIKGLVVEKHQIDTINYYY